MKHKKIQGINPMVLSAPWPDYRKNNYSQTWKCNKQPYNLTQKYARD